MAEEPKGGFLSWAADKIGFGEKPPAPLSQSCQQIVNEKAAGIAESIKPSDPHTMNLNKMYQAMREIKEAGVSGGTTCNANEVTLQHVKVAVNAERNTTVASR